MQCRFRDTHPIRVGNDPTDLVRGGPYRQRLGINDCVIGTLDAGAAIAEGKVTIDGAATVMLPLVGLMAEPDPAFNIVTP